MTADGANMDALTGAYDRAGLQEGLQRALQDAQAHGAPCSVMLFDLDHFKSVNDAFGHQRGDQALVECVARLKGVLRPSDQLFRYGGDEFVLILPGTDKAQAIRVSDRMLHCIRSVPFPGEPPLTASITLGIAVFPVDGETPEELFAKADARLYAAKRDGRGRAVADDAAPGGVNPLAGATRLIEREAALESLVTFLETVPGQRGVLAVVGARGSGRSRFLTEAGNIARLQGMAVLTLHASEALQARSRGALSEALADWGMLPSDSANHDALIAALQQRLTTKGHAGLLVLADNLSLLDAESLGFLRSLFAAGSFPMLALAYATEPDQVNRAPVLDATLQRTIHLAPLTPDGLRVWLRSTLQNEPAPAFVDWLHRETLGLPRLAEEGLAELKGQQLLWQEDAGQWHVSPTYRETHLREQIEAKRTAPRHNLPAPLTTFVGRGEEILLAKQRLESGRLLTLLGPGGSGKTRLALQVAAELAPRFADGVRLTQLAPVQATDEIIPMLLETLQITPSERTAPKAQLLQFLQNKQMLLVLDNFEHLIEGADLVTEILQAAPHVRILVTSRERLHLPGEALLELSGLPVPEDENGRSGWNEASLRLFVDRAHLGDASFVLTAEQVPWAVRICQQVQGMPLGIELAAAWTRTMTCEEIAAGIAQGLDFLVTHQPHLAERHRSLRAVFGHSWQCLSPEVRQVFARLSVFRGGFSRAAAAQVAGASPFTLAGLLDKSLLRRSASGRYEVHELLREYALEALGSGGDEVRGHHADYCLVFAREAAADLEGPLQVETWDRLTREHANLRAALRWYIDHADGEKALELVGALWRFWEMRGHLREGRKWVELALSVSEKGAPTAARATALAALGHLLRRQGELQQGRTCLEDAQVIWRDLGNAQGVAEAHEGLGYVAFQSGDHTLALQYLEEGLRLMRTGENWQGLVRVLGILGAVAQAQGRFADATRLWEEGLARARELGNKYASAALLNNLSVTLTSMREYDRARAYMVECLALNRAMGTKPMSAAVLGNLGVVSLIQGDLSAAGAYLQECLAIVREIDWKIYIGLALGDLGLLARRQGELALAGARHRESLAVEQALGFKLGVAYYLLGMAGVAAAAGDAGKAARLLGAGEALLTSIQSKPDLIYQQESDYATAVASGQLGEAGFATARDEGRALSLEEAVQLAAE